MQSFLLENMFGKYNLKMSIQYNLILSKCDETEYSCSDGSCIPILDVSNFVPNCWDGKDEESCPILSFRNVEGYKSDLPDIQIQEN